MTVDNKNKKIPPRIPLNQGGKNSDKLERGKIYYARK